MSFVYSPTQLPTSPQLNFGKPLSSAQPRISDLVFPSSRHRKLKAYPPSRQPPINLRVSIESVIHASSLFLVQYHLQHLTSILSRSCPLSYNLDRVYEICQDGIVNGGKCAGTRSFLCLGGTGSIGTFGARKDSSGREEEDVSIGEFLFEFAG